MLLVKESQDQICEFLQKIFLFLANKKAVLFPLTRGRTAYVFFIKQALFLNGFGRFFRHQLTVFFHLSAIKIIGV